MKRNKRKPFRLPTKAEYVLKGKEQKVATWLFYLCNFSNLLFCYTAAVFLGEIDTFLAFLSPYLYYLIRLALYKIWYGFGYHPLSERRYFSGPKGGMHLPIFTKNTEEYVKIRKQQSLKYQVIYNIYKVVYRTVYFFVLFVFFSLWIYKEGNRYPGSSLEKALIELSGGNEGIEKFLFGSIFVLIALLSWLIYEAGKRFWQGHFYRQYPVKILLIERDEPIIIIKNLKNN